MTTPDLNFDIPRLGEARFDSPVSLRFVEDDERVLYDSDLKTVQAALAAGKQPACFELAGRGGRSSSTRPSCPAAWSRAAACVPA